MLLQRGRQAGVIMRGLLIVDEGVDAPRIPRDGSGVDMGLRTAPEGGKGEQSVCGGGGGGTRLDCMGLPQALGVGHVDEGRPLHRERAEPCERRDPRAIALVHDDIEPQPCALLAPVPGAIPEAARHSPEHQVVWVDLADHALDLGQPIVLPRAPCRSAPPRAVAR